MDTAITEHTYNVVVKGQNIDHRISIIDVNISVANRLNVTPNI